MASREKKREKKNWQDSFLTLFLCVPIQAGVIIAARQFFPLFFFSPHFSSKRSYF